MSGHLLQTIWRGLVVYRFHGAVAFSRFSARGALEVLVFNVNYLLRRTCGFNNFLGFGYIKISIVKICDGNINRAGRLNVHKPLAVIHA